jgi:hypothetical protein
MSKDKQRLSINRLIEFNSLTNEDKSIAAIGHYARLSLNFNADKLVSLNRRLSMKTEQVLNA